MKDERELLSNVLKFESCRTSVQAKIKHSGGNSVQQR